MPKQWEDKPTDIRKGENLPVAQLERFLQQHFSTNETVSVSQFPSGFSNLTYSLMLGNEEYVLRRPPIGAHVKSGHDMKREFDILSALGPTYDKVPNAILYCEDETIIGAPFYLMERVQGIILRATMPREMRPNETLMTGIANSFVDAFVELHAIDVQGVGLQSFGKPEGYCLRQVEGWTKRYFKSKTDEVPKIEASAKWLIENMPEEPKAYSVIHNDFKYDNVVLDINDWTQIKAILDWEMATIGNPLMDLGTSLGYWVNPDDPDFMRALKLTPTTLPGNLTREALVQRYAQRSGRSVEGILFYYVYGLFKIAVIIQQIYYRYKKGVTQDPRFERLIDGVKVLGEVAQQAIAKKQLDNLF